MKKIFLIQIMLFVTSVYSQEIIEKTIDYPASKEVSMNLKFADDILITQSPDNKVHFWASVNINDGEQNDAHILKIREFADELKIETDLKEDILKDKKYLILSDEEDEDDDIDFEESGKKHSHHIHHNYRIKAELSYKIQLPKDVILKIETISGNIEVKGLEGPLKIKSISGFVDITWGQNRADLELKTITGEIYTDLDLKVQDSHEFSYVGSEIEAEYLGGGVLVDVETISSDIYLRKK